MSATTIFCHHCGAQGAHKFGKDRKRRQRYKCNHCFKIFNRRTRTHKSGSQLSDDIWKKALELFCTRAGMSAADLARVLHINKKTAQKMNRHFRVLVQQLEPIMIPGISEWDEAVPIKNQWVIGGVSRHTKQCLLRLIPNRSERYLSGFVNTYSDPETAFVCTDEHLGYIGVVNRLTVCHSREYVNSQMKFVHTNQIEGVWGHLKPLGKHIYRGFPRKKLPMYLSEFMFRYNFRDYEQRVVILTALLTRKTNSLLV
jgi:transposase-like protein